MRRHHTCPRLLTTWIRVPLQWKHTSRSQGITSRISWSMTMNHRSWMNLQVQQVASMRPQLSEQKTIMQMTWTTTYGESKVTLIIQDWCYQIRHRHDDQAGVIAVAAIALLRVAVRITVVCASLGTNRALLYPHLPKEVSSRRLTWSPATRQIIRSWQLQVVRTPSHQLTSSAAKLELWDRASTKVLRQRWAQQQLITSNSLQSKL